ncbi:hypothetical protein AcdelDRAFT_4477, partial [Acidovorax delafieldii 2AN]
MDVSTSIEPGRLCTVRTHMGGALLQRHVRQGRHGGTTPRATPWVHTSIRTTIQAKA